MREWLHRMLSADQTLGDKVIGYLIVATVFFIGIGVTWFLLFVIFKGILSSIKWLFVKLRGNNSETINSFYIVEARLEDIYDRYNLFTFIKKFKEGLTPKGKLTYNLIVHSFWGLIAMFGAFCIIFSITGNPYHEYLLITKGITINGYITDADEFVTDDDQGKAHFTFYYTYSFTANNGSKYISGGQDEGRLPELFSDLSSPLLTKVVYLESNPGISMLKNNLCESLGELLLRKIGLGTFVFIMFSSIGFLLIKNAIKEYLTKRKKLTDGIDGTTS